MPKLNLVAAGRKSPRKPLQRVAARPVPIMVLPEPSNDLKDHFIIEDGVSFAGRHLLIDLKGAQHLDDREVIEQALIDAVEASGATLLHIHLHTFEEGGGISGVAVLAESHISIHTWPERKFAAIDVFMCGKADPAKAREVFERAFKPTSVTAGMNKRGVI